MTVRHTCVLLALALSLAAQDLPAATPQRESAVPRGPGLAPVPTPPGIAGMKLEEAKHAFDTFATRAAAVIDSLVQPGQREQAADRLDGKLDDIQDLVDQGKLAVAQKNLNESQEMLASVSRKRHTALVAAVLAAVIRSHEAGDKGFGQIPDRATFERLSYQGDDGLIEAHLRGIEYVKFYIDGIGRGNRKLHFMNTAIFRSHRVYMRATRMSMDRGGGGKVDLMLGSLCYRPFRTAPDGTRGLYTVEFDPHDAFPFALIKLAYD